MRWMTCLLFYLFVCSNHIIAQTEQTFVINFLPCFGTQPLQDEQEVFVLNNKDSLHISMLKYYISNIQFSYQGKIIWQEKNSYHLVDLDEKSSMSISLKSPTNLQFDHIQFNLGIDSITNVSGVLSGDLDPLKGMYWTWQSGYINFKIEGTDQRSPAVHHSFGFHLGGYEYPNATIQSLCFNTISHQKLNIKVDTKIFLEGLDLSSQHHEMTPGQDAVLLAKKAASIFSEAKE